MFILDLGLQLYQWNGKSCNKDERFKAAEYLQAMEVNCQAFLSTGTKVMCKCFIVQHDREGKATSEVIGMSSDTCCFHVLVCYDRTG